MITEGSFPTTYKFPEPLSPLRAIATSLKHSRLLRVLLSPIQILQDDKKNCINPPKNLATLLVMEKHPRSADEVTCWHNHPCPRSLLGSRLLNAICTICRNQTDPFTIKKHLYDLSALRAISSWQFLALKKDICPQSYYA